MKPYSLHKKYESSNSDEPQDLKKTKKKHPYQVYFALSPNTCPTPLAYCCTTEGKSVGMPDNSLHEANPLSYLLN